MTRWMIDSNDDCGIIYNLAWFPRPRPPPDDDLDELPKKLPRSLLPYTTTFIRNKVSFYEEGDDDDDGDSDNPIIPDGDSDAGNDDKGDDDNDPVRPLIVIDENPDIK